MRVPLTEVCPRTWAQRCRAWAEAFHPAAAAAKPSVEGISVAELIDLHGSQGSRPLLLMLLACLCLPPILGLGTAMSMAIFALAWQWQHPGQTAAVPQRIARARLSPTWSRRTLKALAWLHESAAARIRPRWVSLMHRLSHGLWACWIGWMAFIILIPLPLGNILPCLSLIALCLGWMHRDGLMLIASLALGGVATVYASGVLALGALALWQALQALALGLA